MKPIPTKTLLFSFETILNKAELKEGHTAADFGCGRSMFLLYALSNMVGKNGKVYGVDILPEIIASVDREIKHHNLVSITPVLGNLDIKNGIKIPDEHIDRGFIVNTMHQSSNTVNMMFESSRTIKKDGLLTIVDWEKGESPFGPHEGLRIDKEIVKDVAKIINLEVVDYFNPGSYHYGLIFRKQ